MSLLKEQHGDILSSCDALIKCCIHVKNIGEDMEKWMSFRREALFHLNNFKKILLIHIKLEDAEFYPVLLKTKDKKAKEKVKEFHSEMRFISKKVLSFFEKYVHLKVDELSLNEQFKLDLNTVITLIKERIDAEEKELFPLYSEIKK